MLRCTRHPVDPRILGRTIEEVPVMPGGPQNCGFLRSFAAPRSSRKSVGRKGDHSSFRHVEAKQRVL